MKALIEQKKQLKRNNMNSFPVVQSYSMLIGFCESKKWFEWIND